MSFATAQLEVRRRFSEILQLINSFDGKRQEQLTPSTDPENAMRGLALVGIYSAVERGVNSYVEEALSEISSHATNIELCSPEIRAIFFKAQLQAIRDCGANNFDRKSIEFFKLLREEATFETAFNSFSYKLQNVDGDTMLDCCRLLGVQGFIILPMEKARLNNLKERRNAVSHGRESPVSVGGRISIDDIRKIYSVADTEVNKFGLHLKTYFEGKKYAQSA